MITDSNQACMAKMIGRRVQEEVSIEPPQYNGGLFGLQKRENLATVRHHKSYDLTIKSTPGFVPFVTGCSVASGQVFQKQRAQEELEVSPDNIRQVRSQ